MTPPHLAENRPDPLPNHPTSSQHPKLHPRNKINETVSMNDYRLDWILNDPDQHFIAVILPTASEIQSPIRAHPLDDDDKTV